MIYDDWFPVMEHWSEQEQGDQKHRKESLALLAYTDVRTGPNFQHSQHGSLGTL